MKNVTTYSARRASVLVWMTVLFMIVSAVTRLISPVTSGAGERGVLMFRILLPIAANLIIAVRLPLNGEKRFYVTIIPTLFITLCFFYSVLNLPLSVGLKTVLAVLCIVQYVLYSLTFKGMLGSRIPVFLAYVSGGAVFLSSAFREYFSEVRNTRLPAVVSGLCLFLGVMTMILSAGRLPDPLPGDDYRLRWGDRADGRLVRCNSPMNKLNPYFLPTRTGASNYIADSVDIGAMEHYIRRKRRQGLKHFGVTHVILAAYVRCCAELPALNRFLAGQKIFHRYDISVSMVIKKNMDNSAPDTVIKVHFDPADTADDVYRKYDEVLQTVRTPELDSGFDNAARIVDYIPGILKKFVIWFLKLLDYFGFLPAKLMELSPFHGSMFITSMGSLGIPPIYHHLYEFGNIPAFCSFGCKRSQRELEEDGSVVTKKYLDYNWVVDERIVDGFYYASVLKKFRSYLLHPERLDDEHEVLEDVL